VTTGIVTKTSENLGIHARHAIGRVLQTIAFGILANGDEDLFHSS
jgi:hypothetical protein